jgi:hypothetical protein
MHKVTLNLDSLQGSWKRRVSIFLPPPSDPRHTGAATRETVHTHLVPFFPILTGMMHRKVFLAICIYVDHSAHPLSAQV